ncbi:MAG: hypothetical protein K0B06_09030 [Brevefilum sp.]|nr:hypothetical protein [Brevefilum sp.]
MKNERVFLAATGRVLSRAEKAAGQWEVTRPLEGVKVNCIIRHRKNPNTVYVGTQAGGVLISQDAGKSWQSSGLTGIPVKSLALDPSDPRTL